MPDNRPTDDPSQVDSLTLLKAIKADLVWVDQEIKGHPILTTLDEIHVAVNELLRRAQT